ncbi:MAG: hypothetical protein JXA77_09740 [Bacteroidales bacterium]|nr:hypothetical protein [Bacteroidales bacterium]MBN2821426.1 hypothetical protein [Bacteroidales bacterium]
MFSQEYNLEVLLPDTPTGWTTEGELKFYNTETLYDYIDGGAELYISFNMDSVISRLFINNKGSEIRVEIFDMQKDKDAFGVFAHTRTTDEHEFGQGSQYFTGAQIFWKGPYFISVVANDENADIKKAIKAISENIDRKITASGNTPQILEILPQEGLLKDGYVYFHHYIWLNSYYFISAENILNIDESTDAVLAKYGTKESRFYLLLIQYPEKEDAEQAEKAFSDAFSNNLEDDDFFSENKTEKSMGWQTKENYFFAVFNAESDLQVDDLLTKVENNIK